MDPLGWYKAKRSEDQRSELDKAGKEVPLCSCNEHTSRARLQLDGMAGEQEKALSVRRISQHAIIFEGQS